MRLVYQIVGLVSRECGEIQGLERIHMEGIERIQMEGIERMHRENGRDRWKG